MSHRFFYCADGQTTIGPVDRATLQILINGHAIQKDTPVRIEGHETWHRAAIFVIPQGPKLLRTEVPEQRAPKEIGHSFTVWLIIGFLIIGLIGGCISHIAR